MNVQTKIVKFGNSKGVRLPKLLIQLSQLGDEVDLIAEPGKIVISTRKPGGSSALKDFTAIKNDFDDTDWTW